MFYQTTSVSLKLGMLGKIFNRQRLKYSSIFPRKQVWTIHEMTKSFFFEK